MADTGIIEVIRLSTEAGNRDLPVPCRSVPLHSACSRDQPLPSASYICLLQCPHPIFLSLYHETNLSEVFSPFFSLPLPFFSFLELNTMKTDGSTEDPRKISFSDDYYVERDRQGNTRDLGLHLGAPSPRLGPPRCPYFDQKGAYLKLKIRDL